MPKLSQIAIALRSRSRGCPVCLAQIQPSSAFGSPEALIERGVESVVPATEEFAGTLAAAVDGKTTAKAIKAALAGAKRSFPTARVSRLVEREVMRGLMLGALDSALEAEEGKPVVPVALVERDKRFVERPYDEALKVFKARKVVTPDVFQAMAAAAKRRAFTVANMASEAMIGTVQSELSNQIEKGADLKDFKSFAAKRLEGAGWTAASASHVETIFRTNVLGAYNGGRHRQMTQPSVLKLRPYWQVVTPNDGPPRQRPNHQATHLHVFKADDPVFPDAFPPWDYNCRCRIRSLSPRQASDLTVNDGSFLTNLGLPAPGFGGGGGIAGELTGGTVKLDEEPPPDEAPPVDDSGQ